MYNIYFLWFPIAFGYINKSALLFPKNLSSNFTLQKSFDILLKLTQVILTQK